MTEHLSPVAELLQQHRAAYVQSLPGRLAQLDALALQLEAGGREDGALPALERCVHGLAGSAGTFGFAPLGEAARALELLVEEACAGTDRAAQIAAGLAALRRQLRDLVAATAKEAAR